MSNYNNPASREIYNGYTGDMGTLPVSFNYDGKAYRGFDKNIFKEVGKSTSNSRSGEREESIFIFKADDNLTISVETAYYHNYGAYEWTVYFENTGSENTGVISDLKSADIIFAGDKPVLRGILGDHQNQYKPYSKNLNDGGVNHKSNTGKPTHIYFPYYNLEHGNGGTLIALGWG